MPYKVQFVGLVCFYRQNGSRLALLPDGRHPDGIDPHYASIVIHEDWVDADDGWENVQREGGVYPLEDPCEVIFEGADAAGTLDVSAHEGKLPQLAQLARNFEIDPATARTIARVPIRQGQLTAHLIPQGSAVVSQLLVPHDASITITVKFNDGPVRTIRARPDAEIAMTNMSRGTFRDGEREGAPHFKIYEALSKNNDVSLTTPTAVNPQLTELQSNNPLFTSVRGPIGLYIECSNSGCC